MLGSSISCNGVCLTLTAIKKNLFTFYLSQETIKRSNFSKSKVGQIINMEKSLKFPKDLILKLPKGERFALAGSISHNNVENIVKLGVNFCDLSSSLESDTQIGYKDHQKIRTFINKINEFKN